MVIDDTAVRDLGLDPSIDADLVLLALCRRFRQVDTGKESFVHLAPDIPPAALTGALESYLEVRDDEVLLGIVGAGAKGAGAIECALTTRRIYWPGKAAGPADGRPPRCRWLDYSSLPEAIGAAGVVVPAVDLKPGRRVRVAGDRKLRGALIAFLKTARSLARGEAADPALWEAAGLEPYGLTASFLRGGSSGPEARAAEIRSARSAWPYVVAASREARAHHAELRGFQGRFLASRPLVTPAIVGICVVVYALTVAATVGRYPGHFEPDNRIMFEWGADFGPSIIFDGQAWRLFTCMFLHFGLMHLALNMYCLATAGPIVERLFGHLGFAGLYVLSGLGGSIASLCIHPTVLGAGASGAIFGVFGALLGFLAVRHLEVPAAKLKPMLTGALAFVAYNTIFALGVPGIDMAAHLGGLAAGFICGLLLAAASPARTAVRGRLAPALWRSAVLVACSAILAGSWPKVAEHARGLILADPTVGRAIVADRGAAEAWNAFHIASQPLFRDFERIEQGLNDLLSRLQDGRSPPADATGTIGRLKRDCRALEPRIAGLPAANGEIQQVRRHIAAAQSFLLRTLTSVERTIETGDEEHLEGPGGLSASNEAYIKEFEAVKTLREAYFRAHSLQEEKR
jgi:rhomboid protease GluP